MPISWRVAAVVACGVLAASGAGQTVRSADQAGAAAPSAPMVQRRVSPDQYRQIIADVFGPSITFGGRFEPDVREGGLLAVGSGKVGVTAKGIEEYDGMARNIAGQVVSEKNRATLIPCKPAAATGPDEACATQFLSQVGRLLYRRPMTPSEVQAQVRVADESAKTSKDFYTGLGVSLSTMLVAPQFLFHIETIEADNEHPGQYRLDAYSKAAQLSFFLWNSAPDAELLAAAEKGELTSQKGLGKQVDRMLGSPRLEAGVRAFFVDMLGFDEFVNLSKDAQIYPNFTVTVTRDSQEQTLLTILDLVLAQHGDYRDIFTTRKTFLTPVLGSIYGVPLPKSSPNAVADPWKPFEYAAGDPRVGILTHASFVALHSHPGRSSPTIRGKALRQIILCQKVPDPPGNVDFTVVQDTNNPTYKTARERVTAHRSNPVCAGCHKLVDPMGLALENFDGGGGFRMSENGARIDTSGELDGVKFGDAAGLGQAVHDNPATTSCLVNRLPAYALGRSTTRAEADWVKSLETSFKSGGYRLPELLRKIALSDELYRVSAPGI